MCFLPVFFKLSSNEKREDQEKQCAAPFVFPPCDYLSIHHMHKLLNLFVKIISTFKQSRVDTANSTAKEKPLDC